MYFKYIIYFIYTYAIYKEREIYFKKWTHMMWRLASPKSAE